MKMSEDLTIYYAPDGKVWAEYIQDALNSKSYGIGAVLRTLTEDTSSTGSSKINIVLISPDLIECEDWELMKELDSSTTIAVLTGVTHDDWSMAAERLNMESVLNWFDYQLSANEDSVKSLIIVIISLYERLIEDANTSDNTEPDLLTDDETTSIDIKVSDLDLAPENTYYNFEADTASINTFDLSPVEDYATLPTSKPINTVSYVFRQGGYGFLVLEDTHSGVVKVKFHDNKHTVTAGCVSEKATIYSFRHAGVDRESFDVTLDDIEIGYGMIEGLAASTSEIDEEDEDFHRSDREHDEIVEPHPDMNIKVAALTVSEKSSNSWLSSSFDSAAPISPDRRYENQSPLSMSYDQSSHMDTLTVDTCVRRDGITRSLSVPSSCTCKCHSHPRDTTSDSGAVRFVLSQEKLVEASHTKLDQIQTLLEGVTDPVNVLCDSLHINNGIRELDEKLTHMLRSIECLKHLTYEEHLDDIPDKSEAHFPTLLHFGAQYGLKKVCLFLSQNTLTRHASVQRNRNGYYPHEVAGHLGHTELAEELENVFTQLIPVGECAVERRNRGSEKPHHKQLNAYLGINSSNGTTKHQTKRHGVLDRLFGKKPGSSHRLSPEPMTQQSGSSKAQTLPYTTDAQGVHPPDEFRQRLSTYPLNGQIIRRPAIKVKKPHVEEEDCSSIPDIITTQYGDSDVPAFQPIGLSESSTVSEKESKKPGNKKVCKKEHKRVIQEMVLKAKKRPSRRIRQAKKQLNQGAPDLPTRPLKQDKL